MSFKGDGRRTRYISRGSAPSRGKARVKMETAGCVLCLEHRSRMGQVTQTLMGYSKTRALPFTRVREMTSRWLSAEEGQELASFQRPFLTVVCGIDQKRILVEAGRP